MAVGTVCPAAAGLASPIPGGVPQEHHRFFAIATGGKALQGAFSAGFFTVEHTSFHSFGDGSAVTKFKCSVDDDRYFYLFSVSLARGKFFYLYKSAGAKLYQPIHFVALGLAKEQESMPTEEIDVLFLIPNKLSLSGIFSEPAEALRFIEEQ